LRRVQLKLEETRRPKRPYDDVPAKSDYPAAASRRPRYEGDSRRYEAPLPAHDYKDTRIMYVTIFYLE